MHRRALLGTIATAGLLAAQSRPAVPRKGRNKQGLWTSNFGQTDLPFEQLCAEAARLGAHGFDMRTPDQWPVLKQHGLVPTLGGTGGVNFQDGLIHPEGHDKLVESVSAWIDTLADNNIRTFITVGGQRRGMSDEEALHDWIAHFHPAGVPTRGELDDSQEINYRYIAQVIVDTGYQGYVSHEFRPSPGRDPLESIAQAMDIMDV